MGSGAVSVQPGCKVPCKPGQSTYGEEAPPQQQNNKTAASSLFLADTGTVCTQLVQCGFRSSLVVLQVVVAVRDRLKSVSKEFKQFFKLLGVSNHRLGFRLFS